jgi:hypothetical protein
VEPNNCSLCQGADLHQVGPSGDSHHSLQKVGQPVKHQAAVFSVLCNLLEMNAGVAAPIPALSFCMMRPSARRPEQARSGSVRAVEPESVSEALVHAWWASVLAGNVYEPHPVHGPAVKVRLHGNRLRLSGELESAPDRNELIRQARQRVGRGIDGVDASDLTLARRDEQQGILDQTLISAFPNREAAEYARAFVIKHSRVMPKQHHIVDSTDLNQMPDLVTEGFIPTARKALDKGKAVLLLQVDETQAFRVRELLEEDTRSEWTVAIPPNLTQGGC